MRLMEGMDANVMNKVSITECGGARTGPRKVLLAVTSSWSRYCSFAESGASTSALLTCCGGVWCVEMTDGSQAFLRPLDSWTESCPHRVPESSSQWWRRSQTMTSMVVRRRVTLCCRYGRGAPVCLFPGAAVVLSASARLRRTLALTSAATDHRARPSLSDKGRVPPWLARGSAQARVAPTERLGPGLARAGRR